MSEINRLTKITFAEQVEFDKARTIRSHKTKGKPMSKILKRQIHQPGRRGAFYNPNVTPVVFTSIAGLRTPVKRNELCPCGSGMKYKKCCRLKKQGVPK